MDSINDIHKTLKKLIDHMSFECIEDIEYMLKETTLSEEEQSELISEIGEIIFVDFNSRKDGRNCIETRIVHFPKFDTYIKEVQVGTCHYKDVNIDGGYDEVEYFVVRPVENTSISFE
jgi:hypothetical protein